MKQLIESITNKDHTASNELFEQHMNQLMNQKLDEVKKMIAARIDEQITVNKDGKIHTAAGEEILPSVYRARRQLAEGKWSKKVQRGDKPSVVKAKKEKANPPLPPGKQAAKEKAERLRFKRAESAQRTAERKKAAEEEAERKAKEAKMTEMKREAEKIAKAAGVSVKQAAQVLKGEKISTTKPTMTDADYIRAMKENPPRGIGEKDKPAKKRGLLKRIFGIKEEALARAKAIHASKS